MTEFLSFLALSLLFIQCSAASSRYNKTHSAVKSGSSTVRVLLDEDLQKKAVSFEIPVVIKNGNERITEILPGEKVSFTAGQDGMSIKAGKKKYSLNLCAIEPRSDSEFLTYNGKSYKGSFSVLNEQGKLMLINSLDVEDYLRGVLYSEMGVASNKEEDLEALKAFAVCARNYTVMKMQQTGRQFDVYSDVRDQVYGGYHPSKILIDRAVNETAHLILRYDGEAAQVYYYSSCGGRTEDAGNVFSQKNIPYLSAKDDGDEPYCRVSPSFNWEESFNPKEIVSYLISGSFIKKGDYIVKDIEIKNRFDSGRVNELAISLEDSEGEPLEVIIKGNRIRYVIRSKGGRSLLKSTMFDIKPAYEGGNLASVKFTGRGNGHGVGLCQWGAIGQSRKGRKFEDILSFYFPGTELSPM